MGSVYCNICGEHKNYDEDAQCPNDIIQTTGYTQLDNGMWVCPDCWNVRILERGEQVYR